MNLRRSESDQSARDTASTNFELTDSGRATSHLNRSLYPSPLLESRWCGERTSSLSRQPSVPSSINLRSSFPSSNRSFAPTWVHQQQQQQRTTFQSVFVPSEPQQQQRSSSYSSDRNGFYSYCPATTTTIFGDETGGRTFLQQSQAAAAAATSHGASAYHHRVHPNLQNNTLITTTHETETMRQQSIPFQSFGDNPNAAAAAAVNLSGHNNRQMMLPMMMREDDQQRHYPTNIPQQREVIRVTNLGATTPQLRGILGLMALPSPSRALSSVGRRGAEQYIFPVDALDDRVDEPVFGIPKDIVELLPVETYKSSEGRAEEQRTCLICQLDYVIGDKLRRLPCIHHFHPDCIDRWLHNNISCPICRISVLNAIDCSDLDADQRNLLSSLITRIAEVEVARNSRSPMELESTSRSSVHISLNQGLVPTSSSMSSTPELLSRSDYTLAYNVERSPETNATSTSAPMQPNEFPATELPRALSISQAMRHQGRVMTAETHAASPATSSSAPLALGLLNPQLNNRRQVSESRRTTETIRGGQKTRLDMVQDPPSFHNSNYTSSESHTEAPEGDLTEFGSPNHELSLRQYQPVTSRSVDLLCLRQPLPDVQQVASSPARASTSSCVSPGFATSNTGIFSATRLDLPRCYSSSVRSDKCIELSPDRLTTPRPSRSASHKSDGPGRQLKGQQRSPSRTSPIFLTPTREFEGPKTRWNDHAAIEALLQSLEARLRPVDEERRRGVLSPSDIAVPEPTRVIL